MEERIKRIVMYLKALHAFCWAVPLLVGIATEMDIPWVGAFAGDVPGMCVPPTGWRRW